MTRSRELFDDYTQQGYPYCGVEYHADEEYPYLTYWHDEWQRIVYVVFVPCAAACKDAAWSSAYQYGHELARAGLAGADEPFNFEVQVEGE